MPALKFRKILQNSLDIAVKAHYIIEKVAGVAKRSCPSFPSWSRRFDSGHPLHFFCLFSGRDEGGFYYEIDIVFTVPSEPDLQRMCHQTAAF